MSGWIAGWLVDTFIYTGGLIAAVLIARRTVSRHFGPQVAYALWALPLLRLVMPPLVLPAWMAPAPEPLSAMSAGGGVSAGVGGGEPMLVLAADTGARVDAASTIAYAPTLGVELADLLLPLWLAGAVLFLAWRTHTYLAMRRQLLADARPVGEAGRVRLVETPAVDSPVAFGVRDKVVALPPAFMAYHDRDARDLAIAHELAHHRGKDLLANIAAQPLLALHWFNPLAWWGWRAMRRDQEAACDARVIAGRARGERALYASVIAGFAAGDKRLALASPMACPSLACPMLGEKSIIHRLRSLSMSEVPTIRRRSGLAAIAAAALGLPLTASITYAAPTASEQPELPEPPEPPAALAFDESGAPLPPAPPVAPGEIGEPDAAAWHLDPDDSPASARADMAEYQHDLAARREDEAQRRLDQIERSRAAREDAIERSSEARKDAIAAAREAREDAEQARQEALADAEEARTEAMERRSMYMQAVPVVSTSADCDGQEPVIERRLKDGRKSIVVCSNYANRQAAAGMREARNEIASDPDFPTEMRAQVLRQFDRQIEQLERAGGKQVSLRVDSRPAVAVAVSYAFHTAVAAAVARSPAVPQDHRADGETI